MPSSIQHRHLFWKAGILALLLSVLPTNSSTAMRFAPASPASGQLAAGQQQAGSTGQQLTQTQIADRKTKFNEALNQQFADELTEVQSYLNQRSAAWNSHDIEGFLKPFESETGIEPFNDDPTTLAPGMVERFNELKEYSPGNLGLLYFEPPRVHEASPGLLIITSNWLLVRNQRDNHGDLIVGIRRADAEWKLTPDLASLGNSMILKKQRTVFGWTSVIPPLLAIFLAIITRRVLVSLFFGIMVGCGMLAGMDGVMSLADIGTWSISTLNVLCESFLWPILIEEDKQRILWFVVFMGSMVGVIHRSGGMHGIVDKLAPFTKTRIGGQFISWLLGLIIFFDDYANTLLLGNTMRPVTDRLKISREKLAYIVDSTAAPVAGLAIISTWVAMLISQVGEGYKVVNNELAVKLDANEFTLVMQSIPYRFYVIFAIIFVVMVALLGRDFGPMLTAEQKAADGYVPEGTAELDDESELPSRKWYNAVLPIVVLVFTTVLFLLTTGYQTALAAKVDFSVMYPWEMFFNVFSRGNSYIALVYGSLLGLFTALLLPTMQKTMSPAKLFDAAVSGVKTVIPAMAILWLAWTLSALTTADNLGTQQYLAELLTVEKQPAWCPLWLFIIYGNVTSVVWLHTAIFLLSGFVAFATGSSWGTLGIMTPMVISVTYQLTTLQLGNCPPDHPLMLAAIGSVIAGSIFGDHCSPISDTTVLSSQASSCNHISHVRTQMPYAIVVGIITILFGTLPVGYAAFQQWEFPMGGVLLISLVLGVVSLLCILLLFGRRVKTSDGARTVQATVVANKG